MFACLRISDAEEWSERMTRQTTLSSICQVTGEQCRFLSIEWTVKIYTAVKKDPRTGLFIPDKMGSRKVLLGPYCNNAKLKTSPWINDMTVCPTVEGANAPAVKIPVPRGRKR